MPHPQYAPQRGGEPVQTGPAGATGDRTANSRVAAVSTSVRRPATPKPDHGTRSFRHRKLGRRAQVRHRVAAGRGGVPSKPSCCPERLDPEPRFRLGAGQSVIGTGRSLTNVVVFSFTEPRLETVKAVTANPAP
ncbi:hypothetical protein GCM10009678_50570 [Actinomadura kijaniata]